MNDNAKRPIKMRLYLNDLVSPDMINSILGVSGCCFGTIKRDETEGPYIDTVTNPGRFVPSILVQYVRKGISRIVVEGDCLDDDSPFKMTIS